MGWQTEDIKLRRLMNPNLDAKILRICHKVYWDRLQALHESAEHRRKFLNDIVELAEEGKIALVESGMDCDGVMYDGLVHLVHANKGAIENEISNIKYWADGPCHFVLMRPSEAEKLERHSRDLTMEAFENGHQHNLHPWGN